MTELTSSTPERLPATTCSSCCSCPPSLDAVDTYAPLLRLSAANTGNDHRLGANEAPPAIISIFLGDQLSDIFDGLASGKPVPSQEGLKLELGVNSLPKLPKDLTDRNRNEPVRLHRQQVRVPHGSLKRIDRGDRISRSTPAVAEVLAEFADKLEKSKDVKAAVKGNHR